MLRALIGTLLLCALTTPARAGSVGATLAALPDVAAECRYLQSVCNTAKRATANAQRALKTWQDSLNAALKEGLNNAANAEANSYIVDRDQARYNAAMLVGGAAITECAEAIEVVRAKHATPPACVTQWGGQGAPKPPASRRAH